MKALVLSFSDLSSDPRVRRQISFLKRLGLAVFTLGFERSGLEVTGHYPCSFQSRSSLYRLLKLANLLTRRFEGVYWSEPAVVSALKLLGGSSFDLYLANDLFTLPLALSLAKKGKVLFDAHEYAPREFEDRLSWRLFKKPYYSYLCQNYLERASAATTVCRALAEEYRRSYRIEPEVIENRCPYVPLQPGEVDPEKIRMIYHGAALPSRRIEEAVEAMDYLDERFFLDMILVPGDRRYLEKMKSLAASKRRIALRDRVPLEEIPSLCNGYDIGFFPLFPSNFNYLNALPNKCFEFIQARVALAVYPLPEIKRLVESWGCGIVSEKTSPKSLAESLNRLDAGSIMRFKEASHLAAARLSEEACFETFKQLIGRLCAE